MATRSNIVIKNPDDTFSGIYCHWDGYPEHNGRILLDHYSDIEKVRQLISLGDLSSLQPILVPSAERSHTYENPVKGVCIFYGRDRGEEDVEARHFKSMRDVLKFCSNSYAYLFQDGKWYYKKYRDEKFYILTQKVCEGNDED